jgi:hypothetical protein
MHNKYLSEIELRKGHVPLYWDTEIFIDKKIHHNKPDIKLDHLSVPNDKRSRDSSVV